MSLDDETPTQYIGPNPVTFTAVGASGRQTTMSQEHARWLIANRGIPEYKFTGLLPEQTPDTGHVTGCAFGRTARCTCMYLLQWQREEYTAPTMRPLGSRNKEDVTVLPGGWHVPESQAPEPITVQLTANGETSLREFRPLAVLEEERQGPGVSAEYLFAELEEMRTELTDTQAEEISTNLRKPQLQQPIVIATTMEDPAVIAEKIIAQNPEWFGRPPAGSYQKREEGRAPGDEAAFDMWKNKALRWEREARHNRKYLIAATILGSLGWAYGITRGLGWF
jgi:hypothetical protein